MMRIPKGIEFKQVHHHHHHPLQVHVPFLKREGGEGKERQLWCPHLQDKPGDNDKKKFS